MIDTGSSETFLGTHTAERLFGLTASSPGMQEEPLGDGSDERDTKVYRYAFKSLEMGDIAFKNPRLIVTPMAKDGPELILGMHQLHSLHLYFAYREGKLYATTARGDIAAQQIATGSPLPAIHKPDPLDRANLRNFMEDAATAVGKRDFDGALAAINQALKIDPLNWSAFLIGPGYTGRKASATWH